MTTEDLLDDYEDTDFDSDDNTDGVVKDGHFIWCNRKPEVREMGRALNDSLTIACAGCDDYRLSYNVTGPAADVEAYVAEFMRQYHNTGYYGREESRKQVHPELLEVTLVRSAVCD